MTEDLLYDKDGLFHNIVKGSSVFAGRYEVLVNGPSDLNNGNLLNGIELPAGKYPLVACLPPTSIPSNRWEMFTIRLLFLCTAASDGTNQIRQRDANTNTSKRRGSHDWRDMNQSATSFMLALQELQEQMRNRFMLDERNPWRITRIANMQKDKVSGVMLQFTCGIAAMCGQEEINVEAVTIPEGLNTIIGGGSDGSIDASLINFTTLSYEAGELTLTGAPGTWDTELRIIGMFELTLPAGYNSYHVEPDLGTYTVKWRRKSEGRYSSYNQGTIEVTQLLPRALRLYPVSDSVSDMEAPFNFPMQVVNVDGQVIGEADNETEYLNIWNADPANALRGVASDAKFDYFRPDLQYWSFVITPKPGQKYPNFFRGLPI